MHKKTLAAIIAFSLLTVGIIAAFYFFKTVKHTAINTYNNIKNTNNTSNQTPTTPEKISANIYLISMEDAGKNGKKIGCGDSVVPYQIQIKNEGVSTNISTSLVNLFNIHQQFYGTPPLYNSLYQSILSVETVGFNGEKAIVRIRGTTALGGVCDNPRFEAQIRETVMQFPQVKEAEIYINDKLLKDAISLK